MSSLSLFTRSCKGNGRCIHLLQLYNGSRRQVHQVRRELIAGKRLLERSQLLENSAKNLELGLCRFIHKTGVNPVPRGSDSTETQKSSSSGKESSDNGDDEDEKKKKKEEEEGKQRQMYNVKMGVFAIVNLVLLYAFMGRFMPDQNDQDEWIRNRNERYQRKENDLMNSPMARRSAVNQAQQQNPNMIQTVTWSEFYYEMLLAGEVEEIIIHSGINRVSCVLRPDAIFRGRRVQNNLFRVSLPGTMDKPGDKPSGLNENTVEDRIREAEARIGIPPGSGVSITYERKTENASRVLSTVIVLGGIALMFAAFRSLRGKVQGIQMNPFSKMKKADFTLIDPDLKNITGKKGVKFSDVAGMKEAKVEVQEFVDYLKNPVKYRVLGAKPPKGALMTGPPGCGKTMLAKAIANESHVPFLSMNGSEFIEMIGGLGAARVRDLFAEARKRSPSIIYIDEIDAIGRKRSGGGAASGQTGGGESEQTLNQLLVEMDGIVSSTEGNVIILASTNRADVLDRALLRPGRFDRHIAIDLPNVVERKEILEQHMKGVQLSDTVDKFSERMATLTPGFSGADLANLVNEAALHAARTKKPKVEREDLEYAVERVIAGPEKKTNVLGPNEKKIVAYHESGHALVGWMLKHTDALLKVTILPRTSQALGFAQYTPVDKKLYSPEEMMDRMCMALGGRVAESLVFNSITTGAQNDLQKVTQMANAQIKSFGFNENVGLLSFEDDGGMRPYSKRLQATIDHEARQMIAEAYRITEALLKKHHSELKLMAEALLERETLNYDDVEKLLGPPPFGKKHLVSPVDFENQLKQQAALGKS